jgi:hypothetical protein
LVSHARAWRISRRSIGLVSPLALAGLVLVLVIAPDSPISDTAGVGLFVLALCYVLARIVDDVKAQQHAVAEEAKRSQEALADQARRHREQLAKQLFGGVSHEALLWIGAHERLVKRFEDAAAVLETYDASTYGPASDGLSRSRLRAVRDRGTGRDATTSSA